MLHRTVQETHSSIDLSIKQAQFDYWQIKMQVPETCKKICAVSAMSVFDWEINETATTEVGFSDCDARRDSNGHFVAGALVMAIWTIDQVYYPCEILKYQRTNQAYEVRFLEDSIKKLVKEEFVVMKSIGIWRYWQ
jgi:hypothetical protein